MRFLTSHDVRELVTVDDFVDLVEEAYRQLGSGEATDVPRENVGSGALAGTLKSMPAAGASGLGGIFYTGGFGHRTEPVVSKLTAVFDPDDGGLVAVIESDRLSWLRTGATSAVATDYCAREDAASLGLVGAGKQARSQLLAVATVRDFDTVAVYSPTRSSREKFAEEMSGAVDVEVTPVAAAREAVAGADVICTATTSPDPVFEGAWLSPGTHVNAIGAHYPDQREVDTRTVERSRVIVDALDRARKEEGELIIPAREAAFDWDDAIELGAVVVGDEAGRAGDDEITFFTSGGLSIEYLVVGRGVYDEAVANGVGTALDVELADRCAI